MTIGRRPASGLVCPLCSGTLATWARHNLVVEFCDGCSALFLDRGELFEMFQAEGYRCPPEAFLRANFMAHPGDLLTCPKCEKRSLAPGSLQGCEVWHCTPCNGFLVDRSLLLGIEPDEEPLQLRGFRRSGEHEATDAARAGYLSRVLQRIAFWEGGGAEAQELE